MAATDRTKRIVWAISGARCALCRKFLVETEAQVGAYSLVGDVAHIHASRDRGPRSREEMPPADRDKEENLLLLCLDHHKIVDDHPESYTPEKLRQIKAEHIAWVTQKFSAGTPWNSDLQNYFYINLPRLLMLAELQGVKPNDPFVYYVRGVKGLEGNYIPFIQSMRPVIESIHPNVTPISLLIPDESSVGKIASFNARFYTKNLNKALMGTWTGFCGDLKKDPHIYVKLEGRTVILPLDPRWLTTTTAGVHLSSGQGVFSGICIVNSPITDDGLVYASPLLIGHPNH